jgi:polysaccharide export outer membrane protein
MTVTVTLALIVGLATDLRGQAVYNVGPHDVLAITVWGQPDLSGKYPVEQDGTLAFPLAGRLSVAGHTVLEIEQNLLQHLRDRFVKNPQISVIVEQYRSQQVFVLGEVQRAGKYPFTGAMSLLEALAEAGSTGPRAGAELLLLRKAENGQASQPLRPGDAGISEVVRVDLEQLERGNLANNVALRSGDTIFVPRGETVFVLGHVNKPGEYALRKAGTTVLQVLAVAGGISEQGSLRRIRIVRRDAEQTLEMKATVRDAVRPGDTVMVGERVF